MSDARILTDDELRQIGALQVTPGSWRVLFGTDVTSAEDDADAGDLAVADCGVPSLLTPGEQRQNAQIIAAAPDLRRTALHLLQRAAALEAERDDLRARLAVALDGLCPDCGGSGHGADACDGPGHHTPPCPSCEGSGLAPGARRMAAQRNAAWAERDAAQAHVAELEAPGECASIHKLRAQVADLQAVIERVRPVVGVLAEACSRCAEGTITDVATRAFAGLMIPMGRGDDTFDVAAAWFRSLLSTAPDPVHRPGHTDLMVAPESVPDLAPQPPPTPGESEDAALRETIARLEAEMSKPPAGPWRDVADAARRRDLRGGVVAEVSPFGWWAFCLPGVGAADLAAYGPESGEEGRRLADAAAVAAGWRLCDRA